MNAPLLALSALLSTAALAAPDSDERSLSKITLSDGQQLHGYLVEETEEQYVLEVAGGGRMELPAASVRSITTDQRARVDERGQLNEGDPNRTRYFYSPSAHMLKQGEGYFSQKELLFSSVAYGVTDNLSVLAGAVLPAWLAPGFTGMNFIVGAKLGGQVADGIHLAAGAETLMLPNFGMGSTMPMLGGFLFGTATFGGEDQHFSVSVGRPFFVSQYSTSLPLEVIITASGSLRLGRHLALVTENWLLPSSAGTVGLVSGGLRFIAGRIAVDVGGVWGITQYGSSVIPIPWLDFTYNFG